MTSEIGELGVLRSKHTKEFVETSQFTEEERSLIKTIFVSKNKQIVRDRHREGHVYTIDDADIRHIDLGLLPVLIDKLVKLLIIKKIAPMPNLSDLSERYEFTAVGMDVARFMMND